MKYVLLFSVCATLGVAYAGDIKIIANSSVGASGTSGDELKRVFLLTKSSLEDGSHVEPVLAKGGAAHEAFLRTYLGKTDAALGTYYRSLVFTGKASMPKVLASDGEVIAYVAKTRGAIGYISGDAEAAGVKVIEVK